MSFQPHAVLGVDWTSLQPYYELAGRLHPPEELDAGALPFVYLVYRYSSPFRAATTAQRSGMLRAEVLQRCCSMSA